MLALAALAAVLAASPSPQPERAADPAGDVLAIEETLRIQRLLHAEAHRARVWRWCWTAGYGALTLGQALPAAFIDDRGARADLIAGAATSAVGLIGVLALPPEAPSSSDALEREMAASAGADPSAQLARARELLERAEADEAFARGPLMHAANAAVNLAAGLVLGLGYRRWDSAAITAISGIAVGELQILTAPKGLLEARSAASAGAPERTARVAIAPWASARGAGIRVVAAF